MPGAQKQPEHHSIPSGNRIWFTLNTTHIVSLFLNLPLSLRSETTVFQASMGGEERTEIPMIAESSFWNVLVTSYADSNFKNKGVLG
jgi:hypothetical protein